MSHLANQRARVKRWSGAIHLVGLRKRSLNYNVRALDQDAVTCKTQTMAASERVDGCNELVSAVVKTELEPARHFKMAKRLFFQLAARLFFSTALCKMTADLSTVDLRGALPAIMDAQRPHRHFLRRNPSFSPAFPVHNKPAPISTTGAAGCWLMCVAMSYLCVCVVEDRLVASSPNSNTPNYRTLHDVCRRHCIGLSFDRGGRPKSDLLNDVVAVLAVLASLGTQPQFPMFPLSLCDSIDNSNATGQSDVERILNKPTGAPFFALPLPPSPT